MQLTIFSCSPQVTEKSASAFISKAFKIGYTSNHENEAEIYYIKNRNEWKRDKELFAESEQVLFVLPLYVDCIPGLMMEFLEYLEDWKETEGAVEHKRLAFIVQSGFPEALQLRACEQYLKRLPAYLGCEYAGILLKGGMFGLAYASSEKTREQVGTAYMEFGKSFAREQYLNEAAAEAFAQPERFDPKTIRIFKCMLPFSKIVWNRLARKNGAREKLDYRPYAGN